jgi:hypothetical protein
MEFFSPAEIQELEEFAAVHGGNSPLIDAEGVDEDGDLTGYILLGESQA